MHNKVTLYIATHNQTGLKYFGKTTCHFTKEELQKNYHGSGSYWRNHLKAHGDNVTMEIYKICSLDKTKDDYVVPIALNFSTENNIVESTSWANKLPENGLDGVGPNTTEEFRRKVGEYSKGKAVYTDEHGNKIKISVDDALKRNLVAESKGRKYSDDVNIKKGSIGEKNGMHGKTHSDEAKTKQGLKSKNTITCFDLTERVMKRIQKEEFYSLKNIKYVGVTSKFAKEYYEN